MSKMQKELIFKLINKQSQQNKDSNRNIITFDQHTLNLISHERIIPILLN